jgi:hypothetical protein
VQVLAAGLIEIGQEQEQHVEGATQPALSGSSARRGFFTYSKLSQ